LALNALRKKFFEIINAEGLKPEDVKIIVLDFTFPEKIDDYSSRCCACLTTKSGKIFKHAVDESGATLKIVR
jgi:hypothetical protein